MLSYETKKKKINKKKCTPNDDTVQNYKYLVIFSDTMTENLHFNIMGYCNK